MSQTIGGRLAYADLLRCTAMLAVIVVHITGGALEASPVGTPDFMVLNVYDGLTHWCVPVFVMLSGMFLLVCLFASWVQAILLPQPPK